ncbi:hypothetical protein J6590_077725 [Homalodisca vitripennis]|nr:hypothetical protein J6590_077725 [Homalodisca vitripennis]
MNVIQGSSVPMQKTTDYGPAVSATTTEAYDDTVVAELEELLNSSVTETVPTTTRSRVILCPKGRSPRTSTLLLSSHHP